MDPSGSSVSRGKFKVPKYLLAPCDVFVSFNNFRDSEFGWGLECFGSSWEHPKGPCARTVHTLALQCLCREFFALQA